MRLHLDDALQAVKYKLQPVILGVRLRATLLTIKASRAKRKLRQVKRRGVRAARNKILPALPGVSKLKLPETPVTHLLRSNIPPTDPEFVLIRNVITQAEEEQARLRTKLILKSLPSARSTRAWEAATKHKIERTTKFIRQHKGLVSSLRRVPPEILQEIFLWVISSRMHARWTSNRDIPWALGQVCHTWRVSALSLSALWSHLPTMDLAKLDPRSRTRSQVEYLTELLRRSKSAPLDIYLFALGFDGSTHPVIELLTRHCERWQVVTIKINLSTLEGFRRVKGHLPHLKTLNLYLSGYDDGVPPIDMFEGAPQLRQVDVGGPFVAELALPFSQLAYYKDKIRMRNSITRVVTAANSLEALTIMELCESSSTAAIPPVTLPFLVKLQIKFCCTPPEFLNNLTLPSIQDIKMVSYHGEGNLIPSLIKIISNSHSPCPLKTLRFRTQGVHLGQLPALLQLTPALVTLDMPIPPAADVCLLAKNQALVPLLEACEFFINDFVDPAHDEEMTQALNALAASRCEIPDVVDHPGGEGTFRLPNEPRRLKKLYLHSDRTRWIQLRMACLEGWKQNKVCGELRTFKERVHIELPEMDCRRPRRARKFDRKWMDRVGAILSGIEAFEVHRVDDIYLSELHFTLKSLSERRIPWDDRYHFSERAKGILASWEPLFEKSLPTRRWTMKGDYTLIYIAKNDAVRTSPDGLSSIVYGLEDVPLSYRAAFWPIYMT